MITLATLKEATAQQVFDQVARHLLTQNVRCEREREPEHGPGKRCVYRNNEGLMCAAGCLIGDDEYDPKFEDVGSWGNLVYEERATAEHQTLIIDLQRIHDVHEPVTWGSCLTAVAEKHGLAPFKGIDQEAVLDKITVTA